MSYERIEKMNNNYNTVLLCITMNFTGRNTGHYVYYVLLCILCYTVYYSVLQCITVKYSEVQWFKTLGTQSPVFKRKEKENGGRKKNFHVKNVFGVNACREEYALHPYHISPIFI